MDAEVILSETRKARSLELQECIKCNSFEGMGEFIKQREAILNLELPFLTDDFSLNRVYVNELNSSTSKSWVKNEINCFKNWFDKSTEFDIDQYHAKKSFKTTLEKMGIEPCEGGITIKSVDGKLFILNEHLNNIQVVEAIVALLERSKYTDGTIEKYLQLIDSILKPIYYENNVASRLFNQRQKRIVLFFLLNEQEEKNNGEKHKIASKKEIKQGIIISEFKIKSIAQLFNYLENRYLKSKNKKDLLDLVEIRFLFYVPLSIKELTLLKVELIDCFKLCILYKREYKKDGNKYEEALHYYLPNIFIQLVTTIKNPSDPLVSRKQLNKLLKKLSLECGLDNPIKPSDLKHALQSVCFHFCLDPQKLPSR